MSAHDLDILYEDNHLLAVNKPAGLPTMGVAADVPSVVTLAKQYIKQAYAKPGGVYLGIMSRLDAGTSGVVLLARTSKAAARLTEQFRTRAVEKIYWALVSGAVDPVSGEWVDWIAKDESRQRMIISGQWDKHAKEARLRYRRLAQLTCGSLVEIELLTGRKHQIRVQLAARGLPVLGEQKYGRGGPFSPGLALHARMLTVEHPVKREPLVLVAPIPKSWRALGVRDESMGRG
jgi:23S rRNA pseudouridine1911/1915/1917 synthase